MFKKQVLFSSLLTLPAVYFSHTVQMLLGYQALSFPGSNLIPAIAGIILFFTSARIFLTTGWQEVKAKQPGMMALIAMALTVAFVYSMFLTISEFFGYNFGHMDFWWELATLTTIMLIGHWIEMSAVMSASNALGELKSLLPDTAIKVSTGKQISVPVEQLVVGDEILVGPGSQVPVDGVVVSGSAKVNESMLTGESSQVEKTAGDTVFAGTKLTFDGELSSGLLIVKATGTGANTAFSQILKLVELAQQSKSKTQRLADRAAGWLFYVAFASALLTAVYWWIN
ncbi:MAG: HAD-IC family P-type ATPase [Rhodoluna sp.]